MLGAHEHLDPVQAALLVEQLEEIGLPIHDADHPRLAAHRRRRLLDIAQTVGPTPHLAGLVWRQRRGGFRVLRRLPATRRRIETATQHPQRQPLAIDRQGQMQMQAERLRSRLVAPDDAQTLAVGARRKAEVRPVLDTQHRLLAAHPLHRARAVRRQNVRGRDLRLRRLVDEPVVALDRRAVVGRIGGEGLSGQRCQQPRALDQTRRQTLVAQRRSSKLVRRPLGAVESVAGRQRRRRCDPRQPQLPAPARLQLVHIHRLDRAGPRMSPVLAPAPGGVADPHEVGRLEAGSVVRKADKGLNQPRAVPVADLEIRRQTMQHLAQHRAGQVTALHAGADQEPAQAQHPVQMGLALPIAPPHPRLARPQMQRRSRKPDRAEHPVRRNNQIAHLATGKCRRASGMLEVQQGIPQQALRAFLDPHQRQPLDRFHRTRHPRGRRHRLVETPRRGSAPTAPGRRQHNPPRPLQPVERFEATRKLGRPAGIDKTELRAHPPPHRRAAVQRLVRHNVREAGLRLRCTQGLQNLALDHHAVTYTRQKPICPSLRCGYRAGLASGT